MAMVTPKAVPNGAKREVGDVRTASSYISTSYDPDSSSGLDYVGDVYSPYYNQYLDGNIYGSYYVSYE